MDRYPIGRRDFLDFLPIQNRVHVVSTVVLFQPAFTRAKTSGLSFFHEVYTHANSDDRLRLIAKQAEGAILLPGSKAHIRGAMTFFSSPRPKPLLGQQADNPQHLRILLSPEVPCSFRTCFHVSSSKFLKAPPHRGLRAKDPP